MGLSVCVCLRMGLSVCVCVCAFALQSTPLHLAAGYNRVKSVKLLLRHGADVQAKDKG